MAMTSFGEGGRRYMDGPRLLDGPRRRPLQPRVAPPVPVAPAQPVFEYRDRPPQRSRLRRYWLRAAGATGALVIVTVGWFALQTFDAVHKVIGHAGAGAPALAGSLKPSQLAGEGSGRVNILVLGIGGEGHSGPNLSDTMMVWSIDPQTKDVAMLSIPRDLYVKIPGHGYGKINSANALGGPLLAESVVQQVIGVPINYYVLIDFSGFKQAVDAVGGIDFDVPTALNDPLFPCDDRTKIANDYCPIHFAAGEQHMDGEQALEYSRSRETTSDFARAARQQQVLVALRAKALSASTLTNPIKLTELIGAIGDHLTTDLQLGDLERLALIAKDVDTAKISQNVISADPPSPLLNVGYLIPGAGSIELPLAGEFDYSAIQDFVQNIFVDHYLTQENALIQVENGSGQTGLATQVVKSLSEAHYNVEAPVNAASVAQTVLYDYTNGAKPYTIHYLEQRFGVKAQVEPAPTPEVDADGQQQAPPQIRIILGSDYDQTGAGTSQ
jgi:LCP family protein required for cell wall assembly